MADYFTIYEDKNFRGRRLQVNLDAVTDGQLHSIRSTSLNDKMSSVKWQLTGSRKVTFYEHTNGTGRKYVISGTGSDTDTHNNNFKDCASSWRLVGSNSIPLAFSKVRTSALVLKFSRNGISMPSGGHMQGIQQLDNEHMVISGSSSSKAYFFVVKWTGGIRSSTLGRVIKLVIINDDFPGMKHNHGSGIQMGGNVVAIGTEGGGDSIKSSVVFYNLANRSNPVAVGNRINRSHDTAGAIGIVRRSSDYLLAVGGWDSNDVDFYTSNSLNLASSSCVFSLSKTWKESTKNTDGWIDNNWGNYQGLNLLREATGQLYLVGFNRNSGGHDWADFFSLSMTASTSRMLRKLDHKHVYCKEGASFRYGGGLYAPTPANKITLLAVERDFHTETHINCF